MSVLWEQEVGDQFLLDINQFVEDVEFNLTATIPGCILIDNA